MRRVATAATLSTAALTGLAAAAAGARPGVVLSASGWQQRIASDPTGAIALAAGTLLWLLIAVVALGVLASVVALLPGAAGRLGTRIARIIAPAAVRHAVHVLVGVTLAASVVSPAGAFASTPGAPGAGVAALGSPIPPLGEPGGHVTESSPAAPPPVVAPSTAQPTSPPTVHQSPGTPASPADHSGPGHPRVVVEPGDTLWSLAGRSLGGHATPAQIAAEWPRWWAANRAAIGADPDLIHPGAQLTPPS